MEAKIGDLSVELTELKEVRRTMIIKKERLKKSSEDQQVELFSLCAQVAEMDIKEKHITELENVNKALSNELNKIVLHLIY